MPANLENSAVATRLEKVSFHCNPKERQCQKCSNYLTIVLVSHASKVMLKILQARLQQCMNRELADVQAGFRKGRGTRDQIANIHWIIEKAREFMKNVYCAHLWMKYSLGISNFLEEISSLAHSIVFLYFFALITEEGFLISPCYSWELCIQMDTSFLFFFAFHFSSFHSYL